MVNAQVSAAWAVFGSIALASWAGPALADQCAELRAHIARLDQMIANDHIASSRNLRIQDRNNHANAYNSICTGGGGGGGSGGGNGGGGGANRGAATLGIGMGILGILRDFAQHAEQQRLQEQQEAEEWMRRQQHEATLTEARRQAEEIEKRRKARALDDRRRQAMINPWAPTQARGDNPFESSSRAQPSSDNPFDTPTPPARTQTARAGGEPARGFKSDEEIRSFCARSSNPSMCELAEQDARARNPAYRKWKEQQRAGQDEALRQAQANLDKAIADYQRQMAARGAGAQNFPIEAFRQPPIARGNDGLEECRRGAVRPDQIAGCYEQPRGGTTAATPQPSKKEQLRRLLRRKQAASGAPGTSTEPEWEWVWVEEPEVAAVPAPPPSTVNPPPGHRREVMTEDQCKLWKGRFHTPDGSVIPVCDYPITPDLNPAIVGDVGDVRQEMEEELRAIERERQERERTPPAQ